ncbi:hypothetical protein GJ744_009994 [Endocarpon pusillum]|uniref:Uncharacterized protein n=1 Tax=Endocarpon pusillum TaxID=364733 RepID=A0A8H7AMK1_9EURO|nr:hypothetical protein GJ744_009994 [Endocarpon pusillum]
MEKNSQKVPSNIAAHLEDAAAAVHTELSSTDKDNVTEPPELASAVPQERSELENVSHHRYHEEKWYHESEEPVSKKPSRRRKESGKGHPRSAELHKLPKPLTLFSRTATGLDLPPSKENFLNAMKENDQLISELEELEEDLAKREKASRRLRREISDLATQNEDLQRQLQRQESQIRLVQDVQLRSVETKSFLRAEDDSSIRQKLRTMGARWKSWAKDYSVRSLDFAKDADQLAASKIYQSLTVPDELLSPKNASIAPGIILNTALAEFVTNLITRKPFFSLPNGLSSRSEQSGAQLNISTAFDLEYRRIQTKGDESLAHRWRSLTLFMVDPPEHESKTQPENFQEARRRKEAYYHYATDLFEEYARVIFRKTDTVRRREELFGIIQGAGELFSSLWKQKTFIETRLSDHYRQKAFDITSDQIEAHPALHLEEGDAKMDGSPIEMVVQPAVLAWGNEEGEDYDKYKVWAKAVVWLGARPPQQSRIKA